MNCVDICIQKLTVLREQPNLKNVCSPQGIVHGKYDPQFGWEGTRLTSLPSNHDDGTHQGNLRSKEYTGDE